MRNYIKELPEISSAEKVHLNLFDVTVTAQFGFWVFGKTNNSVYFFRDINNI